MKKLTILLCVALCICMLTACQNNTNHSENNTNPSNTTKPIEQQDPQKEYALSPATLVQYANSTGQLSNYCITLIYTTDSDSVVTIFMNDGKDKQKEYTIANDIVNGAHVMKSNTTTKWSATEKLVYNETNPNDVTTSEYNSPINPSDITVSYTLNRLIVDGFYDEFVTALQTAEYDIINDRYKLGVINIPNGEESIIFETVYCTILNGYIETVICTNETQTLTFEINTIHSVSIP